MAANSAAGTVPVASVGVWYVLIFVWVGLWYPPRTVVAFGPLAAAAYLVPFAFSAPRTGGAVVAVVLVVPVGVLVGVSIARRTSSDLARLRAEDRLARAMEGAPISLFACDADGTITFNQVSPSLAGTPAFLAGGFGGLPDVNVGLKLDEVFKDNPARLGRIRRVLAGEEFTAEVEAAGDFLEVRYRPVRDKAGSVVGATCVGFNVTERVKAQRERLRLEARVLADTRRQAYTDELTGLANRRRLYERLDTLMTGRPADGLCPLAARPGPLQRGQRRLGPRCRRPAPAPGRGAAVGGLGRSRLGRPAGRGRVRSRPRAGLGPLGGGGGRVCRCLFRAAVRPHRRVDARECQYRHRPLPRARLVAIGTHALRRRSHVPGQTGAPRLRRL